MVERSLEELEAERAGLFEELAGTGDFRRGSVSENYRRCGKPNCACAQPGHPGHGPRLLWTRTGPRGKSRGRQLAALEVEKVRAELDAYARFASLTEAIVEVNEAICEARPVGAAPVAAVSPPGQVVVDDDPAATDGEKGGS